MPTFIKTGFWEETCKTCKGYNGWLNLDQFVNQQITSGTAGSSGSTGTSGTSGTSGTRGTSGTSGTSATSGTSGTSGTSATAGTSGSSGLTGDRYQTTSSTTFTLGTSTTLTIGTGLAYTTAQDVLIAYNAGNHQVSSVVSYNPSTGVLVIGPPTVVTGSGTYSVWGVNLNGAAGGDGTNGTSGTSGTSGSSGTTGTSGTAGTSGTSGTAGTSATSGTSGTTGTSGTSGAAGGFGASASYWSTVDQTGTANSIQAFTVNNTDWQTGIVLQSGSQLKMVAAAKYNIQFSVQFHQLNSSGIVNVWFNKNGTPIADSNTKCAITANNPYYVAAWNFFVNASANDYYEIMWSSDSNNTVAEYEPSTGSGPTLHPAVPSIIITVSQIG